MSQLLILGCAAYAMMVTFMLIVIFMKVPSLITLLFAKNIVWEVQNNGNMIPTKAKVIYGIMTTKKGNYEYSRTDTINFHGKTGIIVNESDAKAIRLKIQPVFTMMKELNVPDRESLEALINAPLISEKKYQNMMKSENKAPEEPVIEDEGDIIYE